MDKKQKYKTALIGCGRIGFILENDPLRNKPCTHLGGAKAAGIKINYACDINKERMQLFSEKVLIPSGNCYSDYKKLLSEQRPELVIISTWTNSHAEIGICAARNGAKTIICEKPIASNLKDAESFIIECEKHNTKLIINHERRYDTRYRIVKKLLEAGKIGEIKTVFALILNSGKSSINPKIEDGGGPLLHDGTHMIDIIRYLFGDISHVRGDIEKSSKHGFEDRATAWLKTQSGIDVFLEAGGKRKYFTFELQIFGTEGKIVIGNGYQQLFLNKISKYYTGFRDLSEKKFPSTKGINYFKKEYIEAKNILGGNSVNITSSGLDGYRALEAIHAIYLSSYLKSKIIKLPIKPDKINLHKIFQL